MRQDRLALRFRAGCLKKVDDSVGEGVVVAKEQWVRDLEGERVMEGDRFRGRVFEVLIRPLFRKNLRWNGEDCYVRDFAFAI